MISSQFDIRDFVDTVKGNDYYTILTLANEEATEAGRLAIRLTDETQKGVEEYANELKVLISYLRCSVRPKKHERMFGCLLDRR